MRSAPSPSCVPASPIPYAARRSHVLDTSPCHALLVDGAQLCGTPDSDERSWTRARRAGGVPLPMRGENPPVASRGTQAQASSAGGDCVRSMSELLAGGQHVPSHPPTQPEVRMYKSSPAPPPFPIRLPSHLSSFSICFLRLRCCFQRPPPLRRLLEPFP
ncbi:hypothetical protein C2E23DRAFT_97476 [Lenzites betulinus]|nr:hypothetical protein C2E23DRAFT_97476 [Lenzites betulinus]